MKARLTIQRATAKYIAFRRHWSNNDDDKKFYRLSGMGCK